MNSCISAMYSYRKKKRRRWIAEARLRIEQATFFVIFVITKNISKCFLIIIIIIVLTYLNHGLGIYVRSRSIFAQLIYAYNNKRVRSKIIFSFFGKSQVYYKQRTLSCIIKKKKFYLFIMGSNIKYSTEREAQLLAYLLAYILWFALDTKYERANR